MAKAKRAKADTCFYEQQNINANVWRFPVICVRVRACVCVYLSYR